jgi:2-polyprenyl-6-methoxyphenol hydroxylase-like FAD-dependent oxidoreductase
MKSSLISSFDVTHFIIIGKQWNDADRNPVAENVSQRVGEILRVLLPDSSEESVRQLPPGVADVIGKRAAFPLAIGHAVHYVSDRMALVG